MVVSLSSGHTHGQGCHKTKGFDMTMEFKPYFFVIKNVAIGSHSDNVRAFVSAATNNFPVFGPFHVFLFW